MNEHAIKRVKERLTKEEWKKVKQTTQQAANRYGTVSLGVVALRLEEQRNRAWGNESNGDLVVVIIRNYAVHTIYLRRASQTLDLSVTRTDVLVDMTKSGRVWLKYPRRHN